MSSSPFTIPLYLACASSLRFLVRRVHILDSPGLSLSGCRCALIKLSDALHNFDVIMRTNTLRKGCSKTHRTRKSCDGVTKETVLWSWRYGALFASPTPSSFPAVAILEADQKLRSVRKIYQDHPSEALQTQQLCQFRATAEQVRLPQSETEQRGKRTVAIRPKRKQSALGGSRCDRC